MDKLAVALRARARRGELVAQLVVDATGGAGPRPTGEAGRVPTPGLLASLVDRRAFGFDEPAVSGGVVSCRARDRAQRAYTVASASRTTSRFASDATSPSATTSASDAATTRTSARVVARGSNATIAA